MVKYFTHVDDEYTEVVDVDTICRSIKSLVERAESQATNAQKKMKEMEDEKWKDKELQEMQEKLNRKTNDLLRGFPINEKEQQAILDWQDQHYTNQHNAPDINSRIRMQGVSGGLFSYIFLPTSIGTSGFCRCGACYRKALSNVDLVDNYNSYSAYLDDLQRAKDKYDAEFEFQHIG